MLKDNKHKILIAFSAVFITLVMVFTAVSAISDNFGTYSGAPEFAPNATSPPYNITVMEKGLPTGFDWYIFGHSGGVYGYSFSTTQYINYTGLENGSYYFTAYGYSTSTNNYAPNPASFTLILSGSSVKQTIVFSNTTNPSSPTYYQLNLSITNMPASIPGSPQWYWDVSVTGVNVLYNSQTTSYTTKMNLYNLENGTYNYQVSTSGTSQSSSNVYGTALTPTTGQFTVSGKNVNLKFQIHFLKQYNLKFTESGLPSSQSFSVYLDSPSLGVSLNNQTYVSVSNNLNFKLLNGTYYYNVNAGSGSYTASPYQGTITVSGNSVTVNVAFKLSRSTYGVLFKITNPPANLKNSEWNWELYLNGSDYYSYNSTIFLSGLGNGTYFYDVYGNGIAFTVGYGSFTVAGKTVSVNLHIQSSYTVQFKIHNLTSFSTGPPILTSVITNMATGYSYSPYSTNGTLVLTDMVNGTYQYRLTVPPPYTLDKTNGTFTVNGTGVTIALTGTEGSMYLVQFLENGIPLWGSDWGIVIDNGFVYNDTYKSPSLSTTSAPLPYIVDMPNGTYSVQGFIYYNGHYHFTAPKTVKIDGKSQNVTFQFAATGSPVTSSGVYNGLYLLVGIALAVIVVAGLAIYFVRKRNNSGP